MKLFKTLLLFSISTLLLFTESKAQIESDQISIELGINFTGVTLVKYDIPESSFQIGAEFLDANVYRKSREFKRIAYSISYSENRFSHDLVYPNVDFTNRVNFYRRAISVIVRTSIYEFNRDQFAWISLDYGLSISDKLEYTLDAGSVSQNGSKRIRDYNFLAGFSFQWFLTKSTSVKAGAHRYLMSYFKSKERKDTFANMLRFRVETLYVTSISLVYTW